MQGGNYSPDTTAQQIFKEHVLGLREIPLEELMAEFSVSEILKIDAYHQAAQDIGALALQPIPETIAEKHGEQANMLADNTSSYDDEGEDMLIEDAVIQRVIAARRTDGSTEMTQLFRVRRSVVAFMLAQWEVIEEIHELGQAG